MSKLPQTLKNRTHMTWKHAITTAVKRHGKRLVESIAASERASTSRSPCEGRTDSEIPHRTHSQTRQGRKRLRYSVLHQEYRKGVVAQVTDRTHYGISDKSPSKSPTAKTSVPVGQNVVDEVVRDQCDCNGNKECVLE